jgi:protein-disulfide isomerase
MKRTLMSAILMMGFSLQAHALDLGQLSEDDRAVFRDEVRAYLLENPEIIVEALEVLKTKQAEAEQQTDLVLVQNNADALFNAATDWVGGNPNGDITIVEFMDYRCGYCKKAHAEVAELVKSDGNVRLILKEYPILGEESDLAARFAIAVRQLGGDDAYKAAHDTLMTLRGEFSSASLERIATDLGLDAAAVNSRMQAPEVTSVLEANHSLGETMMINGTPTFVVKQTLLRGYLPLDGMRQLLQDERNG